VFLENLTSPLRGGKFNKLVGQFLVSGKLQHCNIDRGNDILFRRDGYFITIAGIIASHGIPYNNRIQRTGLDLHTQFINGHGLKLQTLLHFGKRYLVFFKDFPAQAPDRTGRRVSQTQLHTGSD